MLETDRVRDGESDLSDGRESIADEDILKEYFLEVLEKWTSCVNDWSTIRSKWRNGWLGWEMVRC